VYQFIARTLATKVAKKRALLETRIRSFPYRK